MNITSLTAMLEERHIAREIGIQHDEARMRFPLQSNTVGNFEEFTEALANYFNHHHAECLTGGRFSSSEAASRAKEIVEYEYRRKGGDIVTAYNDAHDGTNGGMRTILDIIADRLKAESVENYIKDVFDRIVAPNSFEDKVTIMTQFIEAFGSQLSPSIQQDRPERYAHDYKNLIRAYVTSLQKTSSMFRRL
jgi:hypothetical protein